jgi:hypothetical protein
VETSEVVDRNPKTNTHRVGEKFLEWVDDPLAPEDILESVTLYWLTETYPRAIYTYRQVSFQIFSTITRRYLMGVNRTTLHHRFRLPMTLVGIYTSRLDSLFSQWSLFHCRARGLKPLATWYSGSSIRRYAMWQLSKY